MGRLSSLSSLSHIRTLSKGDTFIAGALALLLLVLIGMGIYALQREFLVEVPSRGGSLLEGAVGAPRFINPLLALSDADRDVVTLTYAGLMGYGKDGTLVPALAETYEKSEDGTVYRFRLRENLRFSDGTPLTAEDVVFTIQKAQDPGLKSPLLGDVANITVTALDARTLEFTLPEPYAPFLETMTLGIVPAHIWRNLANEEIPFSSFMEEPVGAGPFKVSNVVRNKEGVIERYELSRFNDYALGAPYLSRISFIYFDTEEALAEAVGRGRVESAYGVPSEHALRVPYSRIFGAFFNQGKNEVLARPEVREALSLVVNREALITNALSGYAVPAYGPVPPSLLSHTHETPGSVEEARARLEGNGWVYSEEEQVWKQEKEGLTLRFTLTTGNVPELKAVAEALRADWLTLGVPVDIKLYEPSELVQTAIRPRDYEALLFGMVIGRDKDFYAFWDASQRNDPGLNVALYANRAVDDLLEAMRVEEDPVVFAEHIEEFDTLVSADYPAVFTHAPELVYTIPDTLYGVEIQGAASPKDRLLTAPFWYRHMEYTWPWFTH